MGPEINNTIISDSLFYPTDTNTPEKKHKLLKSRILKIIAVLLLYAYFFWATYYFLEFSLDSFDATSCSGYGLLTIAFALFNLVLLAHFTLPFISPLVERHLWTPGVALAGRIKYGAIIFYGLVAIAFLGFLIYDTSDDRTRLIPLAGLSTFVLAAFLLSKHRSKIRVRTVIWGLILQFLFGLFTLRWQVGRNIFQCFGEKVRTFLEYAIDGSAFVYGDKLVHQDRVFAFTAVAAIYFLSFITNILYYYNVMQTFVITVGKGFRFIMGTSTCESVYSALNVFLGMSESPLLIKPFLEELTDAETVSIMTSGFATVAGSTLAAYISFGANPADLITATVMSCPAALCMAKILYPETQEIKVTQKRVKQLKMEYDSVLDAASKGAHEASVIVIGIIAGLIATLSFVYFVNGVLSWMGNLVGFLDPSEQWTIEMILGKVFIPVAYIMGVPWEECEMVGKLIGIKTMINEFVAFQQMGTMNLSRKTKVIATFSICGFANPGSVGIIISVLSSLAPRRKEAVTRLVYTAFLGGCLSSLMTACVAGMLASSV